MTLCNVRKRLLLVLIIGAALPAAAQQPAPTPVTYDAKLVSEIKAIQKAALESDYAYRQLAHLSNNIGARLSGSAQAQKAVEYTAAELRKLGLEVKLEKVMVPHWVRGEEHGALVDYPHMTPGAPHKVVLTALGPSVSTPPNGLTAEVVVVNSFDELTALGRRRVEGRIVLFNPKFDQRLADNGLSGPAYGQAVVYRSRGATEAARLGAVASLVRSVGGANFRLPHTGAFRYADGVTKIPHAAVSAEDADLMAYLVAQGRVRMRLVLTPRTLPDAVSYNVVADMKGSEDPEQIVIVSGHLDSWDLGTGAIDDGAGCVMAMQTVQLLKQLRLRPKRTIRVVLWMNEENGLMGARSYMNDHKNEVANHFAAIEADAGAGRPLGINATGKPEILTLLQPLATLLQSQGAGVTRMVDGAGADISLLQAEGVPTFAPLQDTRTYFHYHHTAADTLDKVDPRDLQENCAVVAALTYTLATMPQQLPR